MISLEVRLFRFCEKEGNSGPVLQPPGFVQLRHLVLELWSGVESRFSPFPCTHVSGLCSDTVRVLQFITSPAAQTGLDKI